MKIAVASEGKGLKGEISTRAGRARYYLIFEDKKLSEVIKNPFAVGGGGAGWSVASMLDEKDVDLMIAGRMGPNMRAALEKKEIKFEEREGKIEEVLK